MWNCRPPPHAALHAGLRPCPLRLLLAVHYNTNNCCPLLSPRTRLRPRRALASRAVRREASCLVGNSAIPMRHAQALYWGDLLGPSGRAGSSHPSTARQFHPAGCVSAVAPPAVLLPLIYFLCLFNIPDASPSRRTARTHAPSSTTSPAPPHSPASLTSPASTSPPSQPATHPPVTHRPSGHREDREAMRS